MLKYQRTDKIEDIEFKVIYSGRRSLGISVLPDSSVIIRVPYMTSSGTINRVVRQKAAWITKHRNIYKEKRQQNPRRLYYDGETHLFRGNESVLRIEKSQRPFIRFYDSTIELGINKTNDPKAIKNLLYKGYKNEASVLFPNILKEVLVQYKYQMFKPAGLVIRTMKRRWGSCSNKGMITLSTELIKLPDIFIEYVIIHELCHLKHHNHGADFYKLLSELFPEWKKIKDDIKKYIIN